jgi:transposase
VRVSTAFKRLLRLPGASVADVSFTGEGVLVSVRLRRRRRVCGGCGQTGALEIHDRRVKRWRHLDLGASRCLIECELRRLRCRDCGVRLEAVPWARPGAAHTRDFEDVVAWLAQQMAFAPIARLLRVGWHTIGPIVARVVADHLDERRLEGLVCIGVDEISYRRHHRYLTSVADHRSGAIVWCAPGRNSATLAEFFSELGDRRHSIKAVSIDMSGEYQRAIRDAVPQADICFDRSTSSGSPRAPPTRSAATNGTATSAPTPRRAGGSRARAGRCSRRRPTRASTSSRRSPKSSARTAGSTGPSCCGRSCGCSTTYPTRRWRPRTSTPGSRGPHDHGSGRS